MNDMCEVCGVIPFDAEAHASWHRYIADMIDVFLEFQEGQMSYNREVAEALQRIEARPL